MFNRGPKGAARILQRALGVPDDGEIGPATRAAMAKLSPDQILTRLRAGREDYERNVVGLRANFWKGLVNRWDKALVAARAFQKEQGKIPLAVPVAVGAGIFATLFGWLQAHPVIAGIVAIVVAAGVLALVEYIKHRKDQ